MVSIGWCKRQARGISLIERKNHLSEAYIREAHDSLKVCLNVEGKWKVISGYYACYNALYAILMKCGIKCEIHDCSIGIMSFFDFEKEDIDFMNDLKRKRINVQYYLKDVELGEVLNVKKFISKCELVLADLDDNKINEIRKKVKNE